jgi:tetratricopeptide (TPR) repeat protein
VWSFLPDQATRFVVAAVRLLGPDALGDSQAGRAVPGREAAGLQLLSLIFGLGGDQRVPDVLEGLARDPESREALDELEHQVSEAFEADPARASQAAAVIAAFYRQRADAGDVEALVELGDFLYWDEPEAARAAYQEAIGAGHLHAMIVLAEVLGNVLEDEEAAMAVYERAAASGDADLSAQAMYEIAMLRVLDRDTATPAARVMFERVIGTRHPVWAPAAKVGLAGVLLRRDDPDGAAALYREAIQPGDAASSEQASFFLGKLLESKGDIAGAQATWQRVIDSRSPEWAAAAFTSLVNLLEGQEDAAGLRAAYLNGAAAGHPDALYALLHLGQLLEAQGDIDGAHAAWEQAIEAGCDDAGYWRERMSPAPGPEPEADVYPPGLPPEFDPGNMLRTGIDVLEHGLLPLPGVLRHEMALPVACWKAEQCAVVLVLRFFRPGHDEPQPVALRVSYSRREDGSWEPLTGISGSGFSHDPVRSPGSIKEMGGSLMVYGGSSRTGVVTPGHPASIAAGSAAPQVKYLAVIKDGHEDRRPLESHFGAWVVCTEQPGPFEVAGLDAAGTVLASLPHPLPAGQVVATGTANDAYSRGADRAYAASRRTGQVGAGEFTAGIGEGTLPLDTAPLPRLRRAG